MTTVVQERIEALCGEFRLPTIGAEVVRRFQADKHGPALKTLLAVFELEAGDRRQRRVDRLRRAAKLPAGKTWESLDLDRLPAKLQQQLEELASGGFVDRAVNVLAFGLPGTGKTHAMAALADRLIEQGRSVHFVPTYQLVQDLLAAKRDLDLPRALRKLDRFDVLILDDLGYLKQRANESEVLFTLIAERYERRSIIVTSNMVFSQWEEIFQSPMATAAAIDRIVHHSVITEFDVPSYRTAAAQKEAKKPVAQGRRAEKTKSRK
ncbi:MAG: IS21-like element helper ATPase IstB [Myxococcales bacterium]